MLRTFCLFAFLMFFSGCEQHKIVEKDTLKGPRMIRESEVSCAHCNMAVVEIEYGAQIRFEDGRRHFFDDLGCLMLWALEHPNVAYEAWVYALDTHQWIEASNAYYQGGDKTPMGFGYGAYETPLTPHISFETLKKRFAQ